MARISSLPSIIMISIMGFVSSLAIPNTEMTNPDLKVNLNMAAETLRLLRYSRARWDLFLSMMGISWFWLLGAVYLSEFPVFAKDILNADENVVTWFIALFSIGIAIGSMLCNRILKVRCMRHTCLSPPSVCQFLHSICTVLPKMFTPMPAQN